MTGRGNGRQQLCVQLRDLREEALGVGIHKSVFLWPLSSEHIITYCGSTDSGNLFPQ